MKKTIVTLACTLIAPLAFAQTSTTTTEQTTTSTQPTTTTETTTTYTAGKVVTAPLRAGQKVRVYYTGPGEKRVVERVIVEE